MLAMDIVMEVEDMDIVMVVKKRSKRMVVDMDIVMMLDMDIVMMVNMDILTEKTRQSKLLMSMKRMTVMMERKTGKRTV